MEELKANDANVRYVTLADKDIKPCKGCYACQEVCGEYGCCQKDDMPVEDILWADLIVLATPIYAWYCAAPIKMCWSGTMVSISITVEGKFRTCKYK